MSEEMSFEQYLEEEANFKQPHKGEVVEGTVIDVKDNEIILNIKAKSDGVLTKNEYSNNPDVDLKSEVKIGDELTVKVVSVNDSEGQVLVTYKRLQQDKAVIHRCPPPKMPLPANGPRSIPPWRRRRRSCRA